METRKVQTIILAGTSNLGKLKPIFEAHGATVIDLIQTGWMLTEKNIFSFRVFEAGYWKDFQNK